MTRFAIFYMLLVACCLVAFAPAQDLVGKVIVLVVGCGGMMLVGHYAGKDGQ